NTSAPLAVVPTGLIIQASTKAEDDEGPSVASTRRRQSSTLLKRLVRPLGRTMQRRDFIKLVGGSVVWPFAAHAQQSQPIDAALRGAVERKEISGVVAMAADRNGILYEGAFGLADLGGARPLKIDSLFRIASMTKPITSVAAMQLIEQGDFALDDPVE